jgi:hypothetical protein
MITEMDTLCLIHYHQFGSAESLIEFDSNEIIFMNQLKSTQIVALVINKNIFESKRNQQDRFSN